MNEINIRESLTIEKFEAWLREHEMGTVIGESMSCYECPIAMYLQNTYNDISINVTGDNVWYKMVSTPLPGWAKEFIDNLDILGKDWVTVGVALQVLSRCGKNHHVYTKQGFCIYCHNTHRLDFKQNEICSFKRA